MSFEALISHKRGLVVKLCSLKKDIEYVLSVASEKDKRVVQLRKWIADNPSKWFIITDKEIIRKHIEHYTITLAHLVSMSELSASELSSLTGMGGSPSPQSSNTLHKRAGEEKE